MEVLRSLTKGPKGTLDFQVRDVIPTYANIYMIQYVLVLDLGTTKDFSLLLVPFGSILKVLESRILGNDAALLNFFQ